IGGAWNGYYPELDPSWHEEALRAGLERVVMPAPRDAVIDAKPRDVLLDIVGATFSGARPVVTAAGEPIAFCAVLEDFFRIFASEPSGPGGTAAESGPDLCRRALRRPDLAE